MAEAVLFNLATEILKLVASTTYGNIQLARGARDELQSLKDTIETIQAGLLGAEKQQWHNHQVKRWLTRLKDVMYDAQDLLDDVATEDLRRKVTSGNTRLKEVRVFFSKSNQLAHPRKVANKIRELRKKLDQIKNDKDFHLEPHQSEATVAIGRRTTHSFVREEEIIGREKDKKEIIARLLDSASSRESVSIIPIVGIGGLGKTALAQLVYNDDKVKDYFELKMWVCVSNVFDEDLIIKGMLKSAQDEYRGDPEMRDLQDIQNQSKDQLQRLLRRVLDGKKYLLVLDDLWNEDRHRWLELRRLLMGGSWGSKILVTTRNQSVVQATDAKSAIHVLHGLSREKSWELFKMMAFRDEEESLDHKLKEIGRDVVKKCAGVPLAIRIIGSLLYGKKENEWLYFKVREFSKIDKLNDGIMEVLKLSYDHLPSCLKHCFAYCALFPKDYVFDKQTMIQLWMAQGFIESPDGNEGLEEIGDSYVLDLLSRSFLEVEELDHDTSEVKMFKMHDLMHDLALKVAGDECKLISLNEGDIGGGIRHASFASKSSSLKELTSLLKGTNLRTYLPLKSTQPSIQNLSQNEYHEILYKFMHCRTLALGYADFCIPPSLGSQLKHLRFLDVSENQSIQSLPDSVTDLVNLQTLKLSRCKKLTILPRDLRKLVNLRHLLIDGCDSLSHMPSKLNHLSSLQTLSQFIIQKMDHKVDGGVGRVDELGELNKLAGSITLGKLEFLQPAPNKGHLREKQRLRSLELKWSAGQQEHNSESNELIVWENLRPHPNLARLTIFACMGRSPPSWLSSIASLVELKLYACRKWTYLPPLSELPLLRKLNLVRLDSLEFVQEMSETGKTAPRFFPSLEKLFLLNCRNVKGWWGRRRQLVGADQDHHRYNSQSLFPRLSSMQISSCPNLNSMPLFPWIESLRLDGGSAKLLEQEVKAAPYCPSEAVAVSTFMPLSKLKKLDFHGAVDLKHPMLRTLLQCLSNLESMCLDRCDKLRSLSRGMRYLSSLQHLTVWDCKELDLSNHDDMQGTQWRSLTKLRTLRIGQLPKLVVLPEGIRHVTTLESLEVELCDNLMNLPGWIGDFSSLQELDIICCPRLTCLPDGMRRLTSLKKLRIFRCPILEEKCQTERGADWEKIAHVPYISFERKFPDYRLSRCFGL